MNMSKKPLEGVKVADFTWYAAGPRATKTLADYGAEVIRIEGKSRPDPQRAARPARDDIPGLNRSGDWNQWNTGKRSLSIKLSDPRGIEIAKRLVAWADIVVENFASGVMTKLGLDYPELKKVNPEIIMISSCMQGQTGPHAHHPGLGYHLSGLAGFTQITGWPDRIPIGPVGPYVDFIAPRFTALITLAALDYRRRTGKGQYIDISQYEQGVHYMAPLMLDYNVNQRIANRMGNRYDYAAPHGAYQCRGNDRWCAIAVTSDQEWEDFCQAIGRPPWTGETKFSTLRDRKENEDELNSLVEAWTKNYTAEEVMSRLQAAGVAAGVLETAEDMMDHDPQLKHRRSFRELDNPEIGKHRAATSSFMLSKSPYEIRRAPLIGEDNEYVLTKILKLSDEEIAQLIINEIIE